MTENERFLRKRFKIRNDQHYNTKLFCSQKVFPKPTICLIKHKIESENQIFGSRLLNRNMTTSIIKPLEFLKKRGLFFVNCNDDVLDLIKEKFNLWKECRERSVINGRKILISCTFYTTAGLLRLGSSRPFG